MEAYFPNIEEQRFILIVHSVGSYISMKVMARRPNWKVLEAIHLFPTFRNLWQGMSTPVKFAILPGIRNALASFVHYTPSWMKENVMKISGNLSDEARYIVAQNMCYSSVLNVLSMAYQESQEIVDIDSEISEVLQSLSYRHRLLYGPNDRYAPKLYCQQITESYPTVDARLADCSILHAFVLSHSHEVADKITHDWIQYVIK